MDTTLDDSSKTTSTQPTTPAPQADCSTESFVVDDLERREEEEEEDEEVPSVIERPGRTQTRTLVVKEKDLGLRSTRSQRAGSSPPVSTVLTPLRSMRTRSSNATVSPSPEESVSDVRVSRRRVLTNKSSVRTVEEVVNTDEAFAAKLAMEEQMQSRQLRSRRNEGHSENMRPVALAVGKSRKRRRIDSAPEEASEGRMEVDAARCTHTPEWTLVDGNHQESESAAVREMLEVKSEDAGTPLTSLTSRQSLPSDDTIAGSSYAGMKHAESDMRSTLTPGMVDLDECHDEDAEGEYEEDAEGEPDPEY